MPEPKHVCELKGTTRGLDPLAPNASRWMRFKRWMRMLSLLNEKNRNSIEFFAAAAAMRSEFYRHAKGRHKYVIHPFSNLSYLMKVIFFLSWGIQLWILPICYAMILDLETLLHPFFVCAVAVVQSVAVISFFFIGYVKEKTKTIVIEQKMICKHYLQTFFVPDFVAVIGPVVHNISPLTPALQGIQGDLEFLYRYLILCCYFVRLQSLKKMLKDILLIAPLSSAVIFIISHLFTMSLMLHLMTSLVIAIPWVLYGEEYPAASWFKQANIQDAAVVGVAPVYAHGLLMTCCYFFGISHGGYVIIMPNEEITLFCVSLIGRLYTLYMIADLLRVFGLVSVSESRYEDLTSQLNEYVRSINLPPHLRQKLLEYCRHKLHGHYISEKEIFKTLPAHIRTELLLHDAKKLVLNISVFQALPKEQLGALIAEMQRNFYSPGDKIVEKGNRVDDVYFILSGTLAIYDGDIELCHIEDGDTFGELVQFQTSEYSVYTHSYVAIEYTDIYSLQRDRFNQLIHEHDDVRKYFEAKCLKKVRMFEYYRKGIFETNDVVSEIRNRKVLEACKLKPHYVPE